MANKSALDIAIRREKIEALTLMEFTPLQIHELTGYPLRTVERDVAAIREKWRREGEGLPAREQLREQLVRKAKRIENRAWWLVEDKKTSPSEKVGAKRVALKAQERQAKLLGLDVSKQEGVSLQAVDQYVDQLGMEVVAAVQEVIPDADTRAKILGAIEERWSAVQLKPSAVRPTPG